MYSNSQFTSNRQVIAKNIRSSYKEVESFESIDKINFQKSLEHEAYLLFNNGELSQKELSQLMIDGQIDNSIQKSKHELIDGIISKNGQFIVKGLQWEPYTERLEFYKSLGEEISDFIQKGRGAQIGEIRTWGGEQYVKHADGWVHIHKKTGKVSVLPTSGTVRKIDGTDEHKAHYSKHISEKTSNESKGDEDSKKNETPKSEESGKGDYASKLKSDLFAEIENHNKKAKYHKETARKFDLTYGKPTASSNEHLREAARHEKLAKEKLEAYNKKDSGDSTSSKEQSEYDKAISQFADAVKDYKANLSQGRAESISLYRQKVKNLGSKLNISTSDIDKHLDEAYKSATANSSTKDRSEKEETSSGSKSDTERSGNGEIKGLNIIGKTKSGKNVYSHHIKPGTKSKHLSNYDDFTPEDHEDAAELHNKVLTDSYKKNGTLNDGRIKDFNINENHHRAALNFHTGRSLKDKTDKESLRDGKKSTHKNESPSTVEKIEQKEKLTPYQVSKEIQHYNEAIKASTQQLKYLGKSKRPADVHNKERHQKIIDILNSRIEKLKNGIHHDENGNLMNSATWLDKADAAANETEKKYGKPISRYHTNNGIVSEYRFKKIHHGLDGSVREEKLGE